MINSDNVVRAGLTPKYKDSETLINVDEFIGYSIIYFSYYYIYILYFNLLKFKIDAFL